MNKRWSLLHQEATKAFYRRGAYNRVIEVLTLSKQRLERIEAAVWVATIHLILGYAFVSGLDLEVIDDVQSRLKTFNVDVTLPSPPKQTEPSNVAEPAEEGPAAPSNIESVPTDVVNPLPEIRLSPQPPISAAPVPGQGAASSVGSSEFPGPGAGSGGQGIGLGSGYGGRGTGSGGTARRAEHIRGRINDSDYPRSAAKAKIEGTVLVRFTVGTNGRVTGCTVTQSSGNQALDNATCHLIERHFRYRPALDVEGRPVPEVRGWKQVWWLE